MLFLTGTYVMVVGGQLDMFDGMSIIIALNDFKKSYIELAVSEISVPSCPPFHNRRCIYI